MAEAVKLYQEIGFPALQKGGQDKKLLTAREAERLQALAKRDTVPTSK
jgi:hypothetical protein